MPGSHRDGRIGAIDAARGLSILFIVLLHARLVLHGVGIDSVVIARIDEVAGFARLPLFFAASGFLAAGWLERTWPDLARRRLLPLAWVFVVWQPVVFAYKLLEAWLVRGDVVQVWAGHGKDLLLSPLRPVGELWFLWALCVFGVLLRLTARIPAAIVVGTGALLSTAWWAIVEPELSRGFEEIVGIGPGAIARYFVVFAAAARFAPVVRALVLRTPVWASAAVVCTWIAGVAVATDAGLDLRWVRLPLVVGGALAGLLAGRLLATVGPLRALGRRTLPVYLAHLPVLVVLAAALAVTGAGPVLDGHTATPVTVAAAALAVAAALALHRMLERTAAGRAMYAPPRALSAGSTRART
jgi:uncharacterized membrane protein YcfT